MKKPTFRLQLQEYTQNRLGRSITSLDDIQRSKEMLRFYLDNIINILTPGIVPDDEDDLDACIVDGPKDLAVDFISRSEGRVLLIQAKYHAREKLEKRSDFVDFCEVLFRLHEECGAKYSKNTKLQDAVAEIDWEKDTFDLQYLTLGRGTEDIRSREEEGVVDRPEISGLSDRVDISFLDEKDLNERLREALSAVEGIPGEVAIKFSRAKEEPPWLTYENADGRRSFIGRVNANGLRDLYNRYRYRLFAMNIRNYVGDTSTNKGIMKTAIAEPENLFFFNNGISSVATNIRDDVDSCTLYCERLSIINGAQTVRSLAKAYPKAPTRISQSEILIRVSEVAYVHKGTEPEFLANITRYNNTQNSIKLSDFRSNDTVQRSLNKHFSKLHKNGKSYWYKNKRTGTRDQSRIAIGMEDFAKTLYSFRYGPPDMFGGTGHLFDTSTGGGYTRLFGDENEVWAAVTSDDFGLFSGTWFLCEEVKIHWKSLKLEKEASEQELLSELDMKMPVAKKALERRWLIFYAVGEILRRRYVRAGWDLDSDLKRLGNPRWTEGQNSIKESIRTYADYACEVMIKVYRTASKNKDFMHRDWFRTRETLKDISTEIAMSTTVLNTLPQLTV